MYNHYKNVSQALEEDEESRIKHLKFMNKKLTSYYDYQLSTLQNDNDELNDEVGSLKKLNRDLIYSNKTLKTKNEDLDLECKWLQSELEESNLKFNDSVQLVEYLKMELRKKTSICEELQYKVIDFYILIHLY